MKIGRNKSIGPTADDVLRRNILPGAALAAFAASGVIFLILLGVEKNMMDAYEKGVVYVASREIPKGTVLSEEEPGMLIEERELDVTLIPESAPKEAARLSGMLSRTDIDAGTVLTMGMFEAHQSLPDGMERPVTAGIRAEDLFQVVGGTLRTGDRIHIYAVDEESGKAELVWKDVYVQQAFDSAGGVIPGGDREAAAQRINVLLEEADVEKFYSEVEAGSLRAVLVIE